MADNLSCFRQPKQVTFHHKTGVPSKGVGSGLCGARVSAGQGQQTPCTAALAFGAILASAGAACTGVTEFSKESLWVHSVT